MAVAEGKLGVSEKALADATGKLSAAEGRLGVAEQTIVQLNKQLPVGWTFEVKVLAVGHVARAVADGMMRSFAKDSGGQSRSNTVGLRSPRIFRHRMRRLRVHD